MPAKRPDLTLSEMLGGSGGGIAAFVRMVLADNVLPCEVPPIPESFELTLSDVSYGSLGTSAAITYSSFSVMFFCFQLADSFKMSSKAAISSFEAHLAYRGGVLPMLPRLAPNRCDGIVSWLESI